MATFRAQVILPTVSNLPQDVITNTYSFTELTLVGLEDAANLITPLLADLYEGVYAAGRSMANYVLTTQARVQWYDLSAPAPRVPYILPMTFTPNVAATTVPTEVACVLSFQADRENGEAQARRRGRVYFGGLATNWLTQAGANYPTFNATVGSGIGTAAAAFEVAVRTTTGTRWSVWSPTAGESSFITNGWVDNTPDTQRRRGLVASSRAVWSS